MPFTYLPHGLSCGVNLVKSVSGTATFDLHGGGVQQIALTENTTAVVTSVAQATGVMPTAVSAAGAYVTFVIVQNASAAKTFAWPSNVKGGMTISATLSSINVQTFIVSNAGLTLYACDAGNPGLTGGTP